MSEKQMRIRGPKGTTKDSRIVVHVTGNPKTLDDPTRDVFDLYNTMRTMGALIREMHRRGKRDKALKMMTLDARRGYISLEGYDKNRVPFEEPSFYDVLLPEPKITEAEFEKYMKDCTEGGAEAPVAP